LPTVSKGKRGRRIMGKTLRKTPENILSRPWMRRGRDQARGRPIDSAIDRVSAEGFTPRTADNVFRQRL
jgi:hypothetical protein